MDNRPVQGLGDCKTTGVFWNILLIDDDLTAGIRAQRKNPVSIFPWDYDGQYIRQQQNSAPFQSGKNLTARKPLGI